jgi:hypothetical protein
MSENEVFAADVDALEHNVPKLAEVTRMLNQISSNLKAGMAQYPNPGGDGDIGDAVRKTYNTAAVEAAEFTDKLKEAVVTRGDQIKAVTGLMGDTNNGASATAAGGPKVR